MSSMEPVEGFYYNRIEISTDVNGNKSDSPTNKVGCNTQSPSNSTVQPSIHYLEYTHRDDSDPEHIANLQVKSCNQGFYAV